VCLLFNLVIIVLVVVCCTNEIRTNKRAIMNPVILEAIMNTLFLEGTTPAVNVASI